MKSAIALFGLALLALLAGCATSSNQAQRKGVQDSLAQSGSPKPGDPDEIICEMERSVGSNIPEKVCRTRARMESDRDATQIMMQTMGNKNTRQGN